MSGSLITRRILGDRPFAEIGEPSAVVVDEERYLVAVGGDMGYLGWSGCGTTNYRWRQYRVGLYGTQDLRCRWVVDSRWPVHSMAFHPTLPIVAVGTGSYDGGYSYEGELLILDLRSGLSTSVLRWARELMHVEWADKRALRILAAPVDSFPGGRYDAAAHSYAYSAVLERPDWSDVAGKSVQAEELIGPRVEFQRPSRESVTGRGIAALAALTGRPWEPRRQVWDVQQLQDGRVLACAEGVIAESWLPDRQLQWRIENEGAGRQLVIRSDQLEAWVNVPWRSRRVGEERVTESPLVARVSLDDGRVLESLLLSSAVTLTTREDGWLALRSTDHECGNGWLALIGPAGETPEFHVPLGGFEARNNAFPIRHSGQLLFLRGKDSEEPWQDKHVVAVDMTGPDGVPSTRELFPLEWDTARAGHLFGGPGIEIGSPGNRDLVHAGFVHDGAGLLPGNVFVVRRSGLYGAVRWVFTADFPATALDGDENTVYVAFNSGELVALHTSDGTVRWRQHLEVDGQPVVPLSLTLTGPGRLLIGTVDGRILDCSIE
ncbi:hypothetical protein [Nocardia sp. NBC_01327]|uniref:hypothetical protein n=1 Tax=Nocardia sp. NBC_01327 TaxID=2903593 RepID=UPI002E0F4068|nr:hypothetical protein OG326_35780 [Nocardia sp. NBC_01327]